MKIRAAAAAAHRLFYKEAAMEHEVYLVCDASHSKSYNCIKELTKKYVF